MKKEKVHFYFIFISQTFAYIKTVIGYQNFGFKLLYEVGWQKCFNERLGYDYALTLL